MSWKQIRNDLIDWGHMPLPGFCFCCLCFKLYLGSLMLSPWSRQVTARIPALSNCHGFRNSWMLAFNSLRHGALKLYSVVRSLEVYNGLWNSCLETSWARSIFRNKRDAWQMLIKHVENVYRPFLFKPVLKDAPRMADSWHAIFLPAQGRH